MTKKIVFITSSFPFGKSEVWATNEMNSFMELGNQILIIPRSGKGEIINQDAIKFQSSIVDLPFLNWNILIFFLRIILFRPFLFFKLLNENIKQSNSLVDFIKGLIILPKSLFLTKILKNKGIHHIHSLQTTSTAFMAYILSWVLKIPWSYTLHTSEVFNSQYERTIKYKSQNASICRTISKRTANDLIDFLGPPLSKKVVTAPLGVKVQSLNKSSRPNNDSVVIVTPAELTQRKGHIYSIRAAKKLRDLGINNFKWFFYGSGPLLIELQKKVNELDLRENCFFYGNLDHQLLLDRYKNNEVDIVIISSISKDVPEGIPVALMEAMSYEIPVIATDCGGTKELVDGQSGVLVNQHDPEAIANAIAKLIKDSDHRTKVSQTGRKKIEQYFDSLKNVKELSKLF